MGGIEYTGLIGVGEMKAGSLFERLYLGRSAREKRQIRGTLKRENQLGLVIGYFHIALESSGEVF